MDPGYLCPSCLLEPCAGCSAGVAAEAVACWMGLGPVAPFVAAIPLLALAGALALHNWGENYDRQRTFLGPVLVAYAASCRTVVCSLLGTIRPV